MLIELFNWSEILLAYKAVTASCKTEVRVLRGGVISRLTVRGTHNICIAF